MVHIRFSKIGIPDIAFSQLLLRMLEFIFSAVLLLTRSLLNLCFSLNYFLVSQIDQTFFCPYLAFRKKICL